MEILGGLINCDSLFIAKVIADTESVFSAGAVEHLATLAEIKNEKKVNKKSVYTDGKVFINYFSEDGDTTVTIPNISDRKAAELIGKSYDSAKGVIFDSGKLNAVPFYAIGYRFEATGEDHKTYYKYRWFLKGQFSITESGAKSTEKEVDPQSQELTFTPMQTIHKFTYPDPCDLSKTVTDTLESVRTDTTDPAFITEAGWFSQVQTPLTFGAVPALTVTSVPANNGTGVLATAKPTLTFNNVVASEAVTLLKYTDNSVVAVTKAFDSANKVLTITPSANLTSAGVYLIVISGVKDVFGQSLATSVIKFTVA